MRNLLGVLLLAGVCVSQARAVEVQLHYTALERLLGDTAFTNEGRRYVLGDAKNKCNFAYLEKPKIWGENGHLVILARFAGRSSLNMFGQCVGVGDSFLVRITALPDYRADGAIWFKDVNVAGADKTGFYIKRVCIAMAESLQKDFHYPIAAEAKRALEDPGPQPKYPREMRNFRIPYIRAAAEALIIGVDFEVAVR